jgi:hypothetical protein
MLTKTTDELRESLRGFVGTEQYHQQGFLYPYTDGVAALLEVAECFWWLSDMSVVSKMKFRRENFQVWRIKVSKSKAVATIENGNGKILYKQNYTFTDFPEGEFEVWVEGGVIILPSEH